MSSVSFAQVKRSNLRDAIIESLNLIDNKFQKDVQEVVIKPNMCYYWDYTTGQTTDPRFIATLIELLQEQISPNINVSIVESDASAMKCKYAFKMLGYEKMVQHYDNAKLVNLSEDNGAQKEVTVVNKRFTFTLPKTIQSADLRINVPKIKYMPPTKISCSLKNIYGCNPSPEKFRYHPIINEVIVALNKLMRFDLNILDGIIVSGSQPQKLNLVMASRDPVALDAAASKLAGIDPKTVKHLMLAHEEGLGTLSCITKGIDSEFFEKAFPKPSFTHKVMLTAYKLATRTRLLDSDMLT